jgi:hypothetical protein
MGRPAGGHQIKSRSTRFERFREFWFGHVDLAPLGLFRILYGLLVFNWFWQLGPHLTEFFTDEGIMPRHALLTHYPDRFSLLLLVGEWWAVAIFWSASLVVAVLLTIGWGTRLACALTFVAVVSFQQRNPLMLDGSDLVFRVSAFWLIFTAADRVWSVDAILRKARGELVLPYGPAFPVRILQLQMGWIYLATGLEKLAGTRWLEGTAAFYALQLKHTFGRAYAEGLARLDPLVRGVSWGTLAIELGFLPATFSPLGQPYLRWLAVVGAAGLHVGILMLMNVGNFPVIMLAGLVLFLPPQAVRRVGSLAARLLSTSRAMVYAKRAYGLVAPELSTTKRARPILRDRGWWPALSAAALIFIAVSTFGTAVPAAFAWGGTAEPVSGMLRLASLDQRWDMFAPEPASADGWMTAPGVLADGTEVELIDDSGRPQPRAPLAKRAAEDAPRFSDPLYTRWAKVHERIHPAALAAFRLEYARMYCRLRNLHLTPGQSPLQSFDLIYVERLIQPPGEGPPILRTHHLWSHRC